MQDWPLRIMRLMDHAEREHGNREIVAARADGSTDQDQLDRDHRQGATARPGAGEARGQAGRPRRDAGDEPRPPSRRLVRRGRHGRRHSHAEPAAVRRSARPTSSTTPRTAWSSTTAQFEPMIERMKAALADGRAFHLLRRRVRRSARGRGRRLSLARGRRARAVRPLLHERHDREPQGRALRASLDRASRHVGHRARHLRRLGALGDAAGGADVPRQQLVHPLCRGDRRVQAGALRRQPARAALQAVQRGRRHPHRGRADGLARHDRPCRSDRRLARQAGDRGHRRLVGSARDDPLVPASAESG